MTLEELYTAHKNTLVKKLTDYSRDAHAAEDAVQQAYLKALMHAEISSLPETAVKAWLYVTAKNALIDEKRKTMRLMALNPDIEIVLSEPDKDDMIFLRNLLGKLPEEHREIVSLRYLTGLDSTAIGQMLGISAATVRTRLRAALTRLRQEANK